jgi:hypothetical protein
MMYDQVVAALAAEGYSPVAVRTAMDLFAEEDWREEDDDWHAGDLRKLRKELGPPAAVVPDEASPAVPDPVPVGVDDPTGDPRYDLDVWAADLTRVLNRTTGGDVPLGPDLIHRVAEHLLHRTSGLWDPETNRPRAQDGSYVQDYTVDGWADCLNESLMAVTDGRLEISRVELHVVANLLLHAQEDGWVPQASLIRAQYEA